MSVQTAMSRNEVPEEISAVNLVDPKTYLEHDMDAYWRRLRADHPMYWHRPVDGKPGFWVASRYADVMALYRDNQRLTSEKGNVLVTLLAGGDSAAGQMLAVTDGQRHKDLRNVMLKAFSPRALAKVAALVRVNARRMIAEAVRRGEGDFAAEVASVIPLTTVGGLLGVPVKDHSYLLSLTKSSLSSDEADQAPEEAFLARNEILLYFSDLVAERRADPQDDVISTLTASEINGVPLTDQDIVFNCYSLILGGDETSRLTMVDALYTLSREPEQWRRLKEGSVTLESASEEFLRWATPAMNFGRRALVDLEVAGQVVKAGDVVTLWNTSANRDESVFDNPYVLDLGRSPNKHITFGYGPHFCLGAYLARVEVKEALDALRTFSNGVELTGEPRRIHSNLMTGMSTLPVRFLPDEAGLATADG
ncbi:MULTISPECIES: cytochrome P450 [unclassified Streptomyces]|uniref:cytochrome P450 n=1 Tax=unclassified Streptomyces TaxID=2593676 RepID=UPI00168ADEC9|nr:MULTISPECIES: cytochrome P450 [unclassified Streptomyces]MBD3009885.1 cytochrome P450 [Streptomyces sp. 5-10]